MIYRNRKLLDLAHRVQTCFFLLPPCQGFSLDGCEPAHSNFQQHGKGMGIKAADDQHVAACPACHRYFDANIMPREVAQRLFAMARTRTFSFYQRCGWLNEVGYTGEIK